MRSHVNWKSIAVSAAMLVTSAAVPYAVMTDAASSFAITASAASSTYSLDLNQAVTYSALPKDDKMIGWEWADFKIPDSETITKVEVNVSTTKDKLGKWQGAFGSSTTVSPEYWTQTDEMTQTLSGKTGTITWNVDAATSKIIQRGYGGELKFGIWWIDCDTFTIDSIKVTTDGTGSAVTTTAPTATTTTAPTSSSSDAYTLNLNQAVTYSALPKDDKMIGWEWADFNIPTSENVTKVEFVLSTTKDKLGKWQGAFGTSTTVSPDYWTQTDQMEQTFSGKTGTLTWNVDSATSKIIQRGYGGELKFGTWWIDCDTFTIDSIKVYTDGSSSAVTTAPAVTTTAKTTTTKAPATTTSVSSDNVYTFNPKQDIVYSELPEDDRMIGWEWAEFNIPAKDNITKVEIDISTTKDKIGKWQGAFGTSTTVSPDYWTQTEQMEQTFSGKTGTLVWNVDSATSKIIQRYYNGMLKFGTWWIDCDSFTVDSIRVYTDGSSSAVTTTAPAVTTTAKTTTTSKTTTPATTTTSVSADNMYTFNPKQDIIYSELPEDDRMIGWEWAEFNIPAKDNITKVEIDISTTKDKIGKWQGAFGTSTTVSPDYWTQTEQMEQTFSGKTGTLVWNVDSATSKIIQRYYNGMLKFGTWWIDCDSFTVDSIRVYTDGSSSAVTTTTPATTTKPSESTTKAPAATTKPSESTTKAPAATTKPSESTTKAPATTTVPSGTTASGEDVKATLLGDANKDGVVDVVDVTLLKQSVVKLVTLDAQQTANADIIADGVVDVKDLGQLIKYIIKVIDKF